MKTMLIFAALLTISVKSLALTVITDPKQISTARLSLKNMTLTSQLVDGEAAESFNLKDGNFQRKQEEGVVRAELSADSEFPALLVKDDTNKTKSVFFILWTSSGGTGHWAEVKQVQLEPGGPKEIKTFPRIKEDRTNIKDIKLVGNEVVLDVLLHGKSDALCCASAPSTIKYLLK